MKRIRIDYNDLRTDLATLKQDLQQLKTNARIFRWQYIVLMIRKLDSNNFLTGFDWEQCGNVNYNNFSTSSAIKIFEYAINNLTNTKVAL